MTSTRDPSSSRLTALAARQRRELDAMRQKAAARSMVDLARGMLMERLGCSASEASGQLDRIAAAAGMEPMELAAQITGLGLGMARGYKSASPWADPPDQRAEPPDIGLAAAAVDLAADGSAIAAALLSEALADGGAVAVAIWRIAPDGALELAGQAGFGPAEASRWQRMPPGIPSPALRAARDHAETWWPCGRPSGDETALIGNLAAGARAVVPIFAAGSTVGALEVSWPAAIAEFRLALRRQVRALAELCASAIGRPAADAAIADSRATWVFGLLAALHESALFAQPIRDRGGVTDFRLRWVSPRFRDLASRSAADLTGRSLLEAFPGAAQPGDLFDRALDVLANGEPDGTTSPEVTQSPRIARLFDGVVIAWRQAGDPERLAALLEHAQRLGRIGAWEEDLPTAVVHWTEPTFALFGATRQSPVRLADLHRQVPPEDVPAVESFRHRLVEEREVAAATFRIVRSDDGSMRQLRAFAEPVLDQAGGLIAVRGAFQDTSSLYHTQVALAATRDQLSDTQERADEEHRLAIRLQEAITPQTSRLVQSSDLEVAARYRPAGRGHLVSGDWYDTVQLPSSQVMLVIGDVAGHGIDAVTGMVALRNSLRGLAITGADPGALLGSLNAVACHLTDDIIGTAVCGIYDPDSRLLRWARAGHFPPVLVRDGIATELPAPSGLLLGADPDATYEDAGVILRHGDTLLLFTDGLIEHKDEPIDASVRTLLDIASKPVSDLGDYVSLLVTEADSDTDDDACLMAVSIR